MREGWNEPGALARRYAPAVYRLAYARTGCQADAEDVMQEVFLRLVKAAPVFDSEDHARAWSSLSKTGAAFTRRRKTSCITSSASAWQPVLA